MQERWHDKGTIKDDKAEEGGDDDDNDGKVPFAYGSLSFAGSGPDSRDTSLFIATATDPRQLAAFGTNPWETPVGVVTRGASMGGNSTLERWYTGYGDMEEVGGKGPSHQRVVSA